MVQSFKPEWVQSDLWNKQQGRKTSEKAGT